MIGCFIPTAGGWGCPQILFLPPKNGGQGVEESHTRSRTRWPVSTVLKSEPRGLSRTPRPAMWHNRDPL
jgi:hypothetical protein